MKNIIKKYWADVLIGLNAILAAIDIFGPEAYSMDFIPNWAKGIIFVLIVISKAINIKSQPATK